MKITATLITATTVLLIQASTFAADPKDKKPSNQEKTAMEKTPAKATPGEGMRITASAVSLNVKDVGASSAFLIKHFGFHQKAADEYGNFASLERKDAGMTVIFLKRGNEYLPEGFRDQQASGLILAFTVTNLAAEERRLKAEGVAITMPLREETWGERLFQVTDPNGILIELVEWVAPQKAK